eukprot:1153475-Pelagomonas_calceolata.AAC.3
MDSSVTACPHHMMMQTCFLTYKLQKLTMTSHLLPHIVQSAQLSRLFEFVFAAGVDIQTSIVNLPFLKIKEHVARDSSPNRAPCTSCIGFSISLPQSGDGLDPHPSPLDPQDMLLIKCPTIAGGQANPGKTSWRPHFGRDYA